MIAPDPVITCVDCGGRAHLITPPRDDPEAAGAETWMPGDIATYRCEDCNDRWDIVLEDDAVDDDAP
jgi:predicted nucleic acid-binding Zn ribbon protein